MSDVHEKQDTRNDREPPPPGPATATVNVDVIPKIKQGNNVYCEISPGNGTGANNVKGGVIKLPNTGTAYTVNFNLVADQAVPNLAWSTSAGQCNGFWSNGNACPPGNGQDPQVTAAPTISAANANVLTLEITPQGSKNVMHYQLNFDQQGATLQFDPIVINN